MSHVGAGFPGSARGQGRVRRAGGSMSRGGSGRRCARRVRATGRPRPEVWVLGRRGPGRGRARARVRAATRGGQRLDDRAAPSRCRRGPRPSMLESLHTIGPGGKGGGGLRLAAPPQAPAVPPLRRRQPDRTRAPTSPAVVGVPMGERASRRARRQRDDLTGRSTTLVDSRRDRAASGSSMRSSASATAAKAAPSADSTRPPPWICSSSAFVSLS